jgi:hypothetical protein
MTRRTNQMRPRVYGIRNALPLQLRSEKIKITERVCSLSRGGPGGHCRYLADRVPLHTSFKSRQSARRASTRHHVPCSTRPCLFTKAGSGASMCPVAPDPASLLGRAPVPPCIPRLRALPPYQEVCGTTMRLMASDPASLPEGLRRYHTSCGSLWTSSLKHREMPNWPVVQLGLRVSKARSHVFKVPDIRAIVGL